jgi:hypothetical protein
MRGRLLPGALVVAGLAVLLVRVVPDVRGTPLFEDEAVSGLVAARPVREILGTVLWDRGGSPLHFLLVHLLFVVHASADALRSVSVVAAALTVVVAYDLARRLDGAFAGGIAALVCGGSGMLAVYGSFGRMYALLALAGALAGDALVRALEERTSASAALALAAGWLLPAVHPYGGIVLAVEVVVLVAALRRRALWPVVAVVLAAVPFLVADARLAHRFRVGDAAHRHVATTHEAWDQLAGGVQSFAGGRGVALAVALLLVAAGAVAAWRRERGFLVFALAALVAPPLLAVVAPRGGDAPDLSPRHLAYALPLWGALAGVGAARIAARRRWAETAVALVVLVLVLIAPRTIPDPRTLTFGASLGGRADTAAPAAWLRGRLGSGDVLFPYSSVFLAALPEAGRAVALPRAEAEPLADTLRRAALPVRHVVVAVPVGSSRVDLAGLTRRLGAGFRVRRFRGWLLVEGAGPYASRAAALDALARVVGSVRPSLRNPIPPPVAGWLGLEAHVLRQASVG